MLLNLLVASLIPFFIWIIQKLTGKTGPKATYFRRRIFAYGILIIFILSAIGFISLFQELQGDGESIKNISFIDVSFLLLV